MLDYLLLDKNDITKICCHANIKELIEVTGMTRKDINYLISHNQPIANKWIAIEYYDEYKK